MKKVLASIIFLCAVAGLHAQHLINDVNVRKQVQQDYLLRMDILNARLVPLMQIFDSEDITTEESEALHFLYAYMPLSDLADYDGGFFLKQVRTALDARNHFSWGKNIPEDIFRHYVLAYRVNNENLDSARWVFYQELKPRLEGLSMYDASLEVNHWCHEKVAYRASDARTSAPLATVRTALGRCGEESTFTVTALRAVGIPARQCYTPRWAHTDDNHAWVEVWVDGKWYFLGACEPDPELNMGWFAIPSTRTMMVHSNCFGKYTGSEEITYQTSLFSRVNMLPNYTDTKKITITVTDAQGQPVKNATVKFKLYNYAEYYPIATQKTDEQGQASITTGYGDLLIWASLGYQYGYKKMDVRKSDALTVSLDRTPGKEYVEELTIVPPAEKHNIVTATPEKAAANSRRLQYEDSVRNAYTATFLTADDAKKFHNDNLTQEQIATFLKKSEGNYNEVIKLMNDNSKKRDGLYLYEFINSLSDKDLRDLNADVIQQHITYYTSKKYSQDAYFKGIISPRISNEGIRPWRKPLKKNMMSELKDDISYNSVKQWVENNIVVDNEGNYYGCPISPMGVYELRRADRHSRDIFFVACCRALDLPAYIDNATNTIFIWRNDSKLNWTALSFDKSSVKEFQTGDVVTIDNLGELTVDYQANSDVKPGYWTHYTIARFENGDFVTLDYEDDERVATFPFTLTLDTGYYMLSTGNRYSDGTTLSRLEFFHIGGLQTDKDGQIHKNLIIRDLVQREKDYGQISIDYAIEMNGQKKLVKEVMGGKQLLVCFIDPTREPTKHLLKDIAAFKADFEKWGGSMVFAVPEGKMAPDFNFKSWGLPKQSMLIEDGGNQWFNNVITTTDQYFRDNYPVVYLINPDGTIVFKSEGYNIGTGNLILQSTK